MFSLYFTPFIISFIFSLILTWLLIKLSKKLNITFGPEKNHIHAGNISRLGGAAIIIAFISVIILNANLVFTEPLAGFLAGVLLILFFGIADDFLNIGPLRQLFFQFLLSAIILLSGVRVEYLANPLGGATRLDGVELFGFPLWGSVFIIFWIIFLINSLNWADGIDGLASGIGAVAVASLFFLSVSPLVNQPPLGIISAILLGSILGFFIFNFHPAKIFMGTSGSMFIGFSLAVISIFSGAKLATLILVLSIPILDALWVILQRIRNRKSIFKGDQSHLHHRLLDLGFSQRQIAVFYCGISAFFAVLALNVNSLGKFYAFSLFAVIMIGILAGVSFISNKNIGKI